MVKEGSSLRRFQLRPRVSKGIRCPEWRQQSGTSVVVLSREIGFSGFIIKESMADTGYNLEIGVMKIGIGGNGIEESRIWGLQLQIMEKPKRIVLQKACDT